MLEIIIHLFVLIPLFSQIKYFHTSFIMRLLLSITLISMTAYYHFSSFMHSGNLKDH